MSLKLKTSPVHWPWTALWTYLQLLLPHLVSLPSHVPPIPATFQEPTYFSLSYFLGGREYKGHLFIIFCVPDMVLGRFFVVCFAFAFTVVKYTSHKIFKYTVQ